jgi:DNA-binding LytR/AlgR family response regulator
VPDVNNLVGVLPPVILICACMAIMHATVNRQPQQSHVHPAAEPAAPAAVPGETFRARLEFRYRQAEILALSAEDHYLRVHTSAGETLILMRLYDAIAELDGIEGSQIHRSWWVAKDAVRDVARGDGKVDLVLKDDLRAPVSRRYQKALKADGWL